MTKQWKNYEEVAQCLLNQFRDQFGLELVEGKQEMPGNRSGCSWEIDAKGISRNGEGFVIVECRRYTTSKIKKEHVGAVAYRITDTGADGAIIVSPLGFQEGAKKIAAAENVHQVILDPGSTSTDYIVKFLNKTMVGASVKIGALFDVSFDASVVAAGHHVEPDEGI